MPAMTKKAGNASSKRFQGMSLEPRIMSGRLRIHPLGVLIATTAGGVIGGIMGLVLAVPVTVVGLDLLRRLRDVGGSSAARATADQLRTLTLLDEPLDP